MEIKNGKPAYTSKQKLKNHRKYIRNTTIRRDFNILPILNRSENFLKIKTKISKICPNEFIAKQLDHNVTRSSNRKTLRSSILIENNA